MSQSPHTSTGPTASTEVDPFDPFDPAHATGAVPHLAASRSRCPVAHVDADVVLVAAAADVDTVLRDHARFSNRGAFVLDRGPAPLPQDDVTPRIMVTVDPPEHGALRTFHRRWFTPSRMRALEPRIREVVIAALDDIPVERGVDLVQHLARAVPPRVVFALVGLPEHLWTSVHEQFDATVGMVPNSPAHQAALGRLAGELVGAIADRRSSEVRTDDVLDGYIYAEDHDAAFTDPEIVGHLLQLIGAGTDTTEALIANLCHRLLADPARWDEVRADRGLLPLAVEESLRVDSPLQWVLRAVGEATEVGGCPVQPRQRVVVHLQSANHDESVWGPDSTEFDLHRPGSQRHRAFGHGVHLCLGAPLARLEARIVLEELMDRWPLARLTPGMPVNEESLPHMHQPSALLVDLR